MLKLEFFQKEVFRDDFPKNEQISEEGFGTCSKWSKDEFIFWAWSISFTNIYTNSFILRFVYIFSNQYDDKL